MPIGRSKGVKVDGRVKVEHFESFGSFSLIHDRRVSVVKTVQFNSLRPTTLTQDRPLWT